MSELFLFGSILVISLYHFGLFFLRKKDKSPLYFGLFCLLVSVRLSVTGERFVIQNFPYSPWEIYLKLEYLSYYIAIPFWTLFIDTVFKGIFNKKALKVIVVTGLAFSLFVLLLPSEVFTHSLIYFSLYTFVTGLYCIGVIILAVLKKKEGSVLFLIAWSILFSTVINDTLNNNFVIQTTFLFPFGLFIFIFMQALILSQKIVNTFNTVENLSDELKSKNNSLISLARLKDEFLANTSHELRTPLNGIIGIAESMVDGATGMLTEKQKANLKLIVESGKRLANLVNDILDFSKLKNKDIIINQKPVDLYQAVNLTLDLSRSLIKGKEITLINEVNSNFNPVYADENRLQQILHNLIDNAIKFTSEGTIIVKSNVVEQAKALMAEISVSDTGIGIHQDKFEAIFQSFEQGDASIEREYGGTGLGLSITKHLVELHGGSIKVESELSVGSKFTFTIPLISKKINTIAENEPTSEKILVEDEGKLEKEFKSEIFERRNFNEHLNEYNGPERRNRNPDTNEKIIVKNTEGGKILIVDDEPINLQVLRNILGLQNYEIMQAKDGFETLKILEDKFIPDLVILDVMMPKMNGYEVCRRIRENWSPSQLPVILLTAKNQTADLVQGMESGANDYVTKPFSKNELLARIKIHLHLAKITDAYSRFVPGEFLQFLQKESIIDVKLGDQIQKEMSILFTDIRSFTKISETMTPKENFDFINGLLEKIGPVIRQRNGFIDKYMGDAIMALFPEKPQDALDAAIEMLKIIDLFNDLRIQRGLIPITTGTGIHFGNLMLGTIGEKRRMDGTVISDAVNLASRLEGLTTRYGSAIIISENVLLLLDNPDSYHYRFLEKTTVKGKNIPVSVFEIFDCDPYEVKSLKQETKADFEYAVKLFSDKNFSEAKNIFGKILKINPEDKAAEYFYNQIN